MTDVEDFFAADGPLSRELDGYSPRKGQLELTRAVDATVFGGGALLAEAPCGTGKSLGYLVPALMRCAKASPYRAGKSARRIVIATANIALQEQLVGKDLPLLARTIGFHFDFALAKGINNYACLEEYAKTRGDQEGFAQLRRGPLGPTWDSTVEWIAATETGDLSELPFEVPPGMRAKFTTTSDECIGRKCAHYEACYGKRARRRLDTVDVIVTNYHLLFAHLSLGQDMKVLPIDEDSVVICDEAHAMAEIARSFLGFKISHGSVRWATRLLRDRSGELHERIEKASTAYFDILRRYSLSEHYRARLRGIPVERHLPALPLAELLVLAVRDLLEDASNDALPSDVREKSALAARRCRKLSDDFRSTMKAGDSEDVVFFVEQQRERAVLCGSPVDVSNLIRSELFEHHHAVVLTSATMTTGSKRGFAFVAGEVGAPEDATELVAESPFDWPRQMRIVVPTGMGAPNSKRYGDDVAAKVLEVVRAARGRTLGLFTSYRMMDAAAKLLRETFDGDGYRILVQGTAPRMQLVQEFRRDVSSVLLGTDSFWTGVDVPGEALSALIVDRIPFPTPDDPILDMLKEKSPRTFWKEQIMPRALLKLRQGVGRLIRTTSDRGVLVLLDPRLVEERYGRQFMRAMPVDHHTRDLSTVDRFLFGADQDADLR